MESIGAITFDLVTLKGQCQGRSEFGSVYRKGGELRHVTVSYY